jgi:aminoglycoside phosphotransferase
VLAHEVADGYSFLLMSRIPGKMSCDNEYLTQPDLVVQELAKGLKLLWSTDPTGCPKDFTLDVLLKEAAYRVENALVDVDNVEPDTFGEGGFRDPEELLRWLQENMPPSVPVLAHGDYCLPNVFLENGKLSGFIDIGDTGFPEDFTVFLTQCGDKTVGTAGRDIAFIRSKSAFDGGTDDFFPEEFAVGNIECKDDRVFSHIIVTCDGKDFAVDDQRQGMVNNPFGVSNPFQTQKRDISFDISVAGGRHARHGKGRSRFNGGSSRINFDDGIFDFAGRAVNDF